MNKMSGSKTIKVGQTLIVPLATSDNSDLFEEQLKMGRVDKGELNKNNEKICNG